MKRGRSFLVMLVVALGLGAYIYFVESERDTSDPTTRKEKLLTLDASKLEAIEVRAADGATTSLKKEGDAWRIVAPEALDADQAQVTALLNSLESAEVQRVIDANPASVKDYGLDPPRYSVGFRPAGETAMKTLQLGNKTPTGSDLYARVDGDPKLVLLSGYIEDSLNRTTFDLREKTVLKFTRDAVDAIQIQATAAPPPPAPTDTKDAKNAKDAKDTKDTKGTKGAKPAPKTPAGPPTALSLAKKGSDWRLTSPADARADFGTVEGLIGRLEQARMKSIVAPAAATPADLKKYGLDQPQGQITLGAGSTRATLVIGGKHDDTSVYARDMSRPLVFTVESSLLDELRKKPDDIRIKDVFAFRSFSATGVDVILGGQTFSFGKDKPAAAADQSTVAEVWKQKSPAAKDVDQTKFTDLLTTFSNLRAEKFADRALTTADEITIVARSGDASAPVEERVTFRKSGSVVHAIRAGDAGAAIVPAVEYDKALALAKELTGGK